MKDHILKIQNKENLSREEIEEVMHEIMSGEAHDDDIAAFLLALREKGPTVDEITGAAKIMRKFVVGIDTKHADILDTCGTGGDKKNTFNISTVTAFVVAGAGVVGGEVVTAVSVAENSFAGAMAALFVFDSQIENALASLGIGKNCTIEDEDKKCDTSEASKIFNHSPLPLDESIRKFLMQT